MWMPSPRHDEGADKHPQPKSNAGIGIHRPVLWNPFRRAAQTQNLIRSLFRKEFWQTV